MSSFANKAYAVSNYARFRPIYPKRLLDYIVSYHQENNVNSPETANSKPIGFAVDVACGTGQATRLLSTYSQKVLGLDFSESMVEQARKGEPKLSNVEFQQGSDVTLADVVPHNSVDLLTVAEGAHWMQYPLFWQQCAKVLRSGGTLAIFSYWSFSFPDYPEVSQLFLDFLYGKDQCGPYWDKGREILDNEYKMLAESLPKQPEFKNVEYKVNHYDKLRPDEPFELIKEDVPIAAVIGMLKTASAYFNFKEANPDHFDIADAVLAKITEKTGLTENDTVKIKWNSVYLLATRK